MSAVSERRGEREGWISRGWMVHFDDVYLRRSVHNVLLYLHVLIVPESIYFCYVIVLGNVCTYKLTLM